MPTNDESSNVEPSTLPPRWLLRRQGNRSLRVYQRHKARPPIAAFATTLPPAVAAFNRTDEAIAAQEAVVNAVGRPNTELLRRTLRATAGMLGRDLPGFNSREFTPRAGVADDVVDNGRRLHEVLRQNPQRAYCAQVSTDLASQIEAADAELAQTQTGLARLQELQREGRLAAAVLKKELVAFRNALRAVLGPSHRDYMTLRDKRADGSDDDEDTEVAAEPASTVRANTSPVNGTSRTSNPG